MSEPMGQSTEETAVNEEQFFTLWTVFKRSAAGGAGADAADTEENTRAFEALTQELAGRQVTLRGLYDVSAMRADADIMVWLHGGRAEDLQSAVREIRRSGLFAGTEIVWSAMGVHRDAEFSKNHWPSYARGIAPETWICVYPFVRSYEWYLLPAEERGKMLRDHGMLGREFPQVLANTVASFALGDWEWILGLEAPNLTDLVDMMRHLRSTEARNHVREEIPFYTGRRIAAAEVAEVLK
ncbi:chlorite dismutase family protein [Arthrobacter sp. zg-Y820]|uniref:hydrogen peroxide-dependent heme synthase n=1 Tax=unclassified Arthrobacter TaxID=235627 RepID=UPI001E65B915|nr:MULTISPECIES: hydrogen peroxide-dependent heme synthase [unclassified Arthrobacter]MCC9195934.1 chlorite dismutase family protein [Arthrobacter sp. zg-Y820]MDK1278793.1 chlorite dismutase family protein [Arthrobacter sp. zg.Y820]MDK1359591.1 chlorite dismutase family protein [Arthrobacter sp. zg-Y1219]WIB08787.1 chlorite dismutase family protein [Arthrobacter sp. zg-Y820]